MEFRLRFIDPMTGPGKYSGRWSAGQEGRAVTDLCTQMFGVGKVSVREVPSGTWEVRDLDGRDLGTIQVEEV